MNNDIQTIVVIAGLVGASVSFVVNLLMGIIKDWRTRVHETSIQQAEHKQKRIELHVNFLRSKLDDVEKQISAATNSSLAAHGYSVGLSADQNPQNTLDASYLTNIGILFEGGYARGELAYLKQLCKLYELDDRLIEDIDDCDDAVKEVLKKGISPDIADSLKEHRDIIAVLMEIRVLFRTALHLLIDKLLTS